MNVKQLKKLISKLPDSTLVVLSRDEDGNGFAECNDHSVNYKYRDGEIGLAKLTAEDRKRGCSEEDVMDGGKNCIVLWP